LLAKLLFLFNSHFLFLFLFNSHLLFLFNSHLLFLFNSHFLFLGLATKEDLSVAGACEMFTSCAAAMI
jgi:hypothetical protein